jgi:hypothetical protein
MVCRSTKHEELQQWQRSKVGDEDAIACAHTLSAAVPSDGTLGGAQAKAREIWAPKRDARDDGGTDWAEFSGALEDDGGCQVPPLLTGLST